MKTEYIRQRFEREGYHLAYCNGAYFAKKHQRIYKGDSLHALYKIVFG